MRSNCEWISRPAESGSRAGRRQGRLDYDICGRFVVVQKRRERTGLNPTLLVDLDRRRPESRLRSSLSRASGLAISARQRLVLPDELESTEDQSGLHGTMRVLDGTSPREVSWHAFQTVLGASDVRLGDGLSEGVAQRMPGALEGSGSVY